MKRLCAVIILGLLASGCTTTTQKNIVWVPRDPRTSEQDFKRDSYECTQQSRTSYGGGGTGAVGLGMIVIAQNQAQDQADELFKMCMEARGYTARDQEQYQAQLPPILRKDTGNQIGKEWQSADRYIEEWKKAEELRKAKEGTTPVLGKTGLIINPDASNPIIWRVHPDSPADKQGMKVGDLIIEKDGQKITSVGDFKACPSPKVGEWVEYKVLRGREELTFKMQAVDIRELPD